MINRASVIPFALPSVFLHKRCLRRATPTQLSIDAYGILCAYACNENNYAAISSKTGSYPGKYCRSSELAFQMGRLIILHTKPFLHGVGFVQPLSDKPTTFTDSDNFADAP